LIRAAFRKSKRQEKHKAMDTSYHVVLNCPRSGTTYLMDVPNALPGTTCVKGYV
jgi:hypothetical protein